MRAVFIDRDGVINKYPGDADYVKSWGEFHFLPGIMPALKRLQDRGFRLFVISNQAGVSKGIYSKDQLDLITANMLSQLSKDGVSISGVHYCIHRSEDNCHCRKPKPGLIDEAAASIHKLGRSIDFASSYFVGDSLMDVEAGRAAGLKTILVFSGKERPQNQSNWPIHPDWTAQDLSGAADIILSQKK